MVENVVMGLLLDSGLTPAQRTDFGITSDDHYRTLRDAAEEFIETRGMGPLLTALDRALGDGPKITAFVQQYAPLLNAALSLRRHWMPSPPRADGQIERGHANYRAGSKEYSDRADCWVFE